MNKQYNGEAKGRRAVEREIQHKKEEEEKFCSKN
jgi:hypothetical protein